MSARKKELFCIIGGNTEHSPSPEIHNATFRELGINAEYFRMNAAAGELGEAVEKIRVRGIMGANITIPHKIEVMKHLDRIDAMAKKIGAVNTIVNQGGVLTGFNTDGTGAVKALEEKTGMGGKTITIVGCGGAARAIAFELAKKAGRLNLLDIDVRRAEGLAENLGRVEVKGMKPTKENLGEALDESHILINASPVGMKPNIEESPVPKELLRPELIVFDIVYAPLKTRLIRDAESVGCEIITGDKMLVFQAAESFRIWTGREAPVELMQKVAERELEAGE